MTVRVGRISHPIYKVTHIDDYETVYVMTKNFPGKYNCLSPYDIQDKYGRNVENIWQFSKIYNKTKKYKSLKNGWE